MAKVLIVEDDEVIADGMARHVRAAGFDPIWVANGRTALARLRYERAEVCVLDLMLPELDGWGVIETARKEGIGTPIVVVSARGSEVDRVRTLELGADDYIVKPFSMEELVARVRAAARRGARPVVAARGEAIEVDGLRIEPSVVQAFVDGESLDLTPTEFRLLHMLASERGPRRHARRAAAGALGAPPHVPRPHRRRLRPQAPRQARSPGAAAHVHPDALRRRLPLRAGSAGTGAVAGGSGNTAAMAEDWPSPHHHEPRPLPRVEDLPVAWEGYDRERVQAAFDAFYRHIAQLDSTLRTLEAVEVFRTQAGDLRAELRSLRSAGWAPYPRGYTLTPERSMLGTVPDAVPRIALEVIFLVVVAAVVAVGEVLAARDRGRHGRRGADRAARRAARRARAARRETPIPGPGARAPPAPRPVVRRAACSSAAPAGAPTLRSRRPASSRSCPSRIRRRRTSRGRRARRLGAASPSRPAPSAERHGGARRGRGRRRRPSRSRARAEEPEEPRSRAGARAPSRGAEPSSRQSRARAVVEPSQSRSRREPEAVAEPEPSPSPRPVVEPEPSQPEPERVADVDEAETGTIPRRRRSAAAAATARRRAASPRRRSTCASCRRARPRSPRRSSRRGSAASTTPKSAPALAKTRLLPGGFPTAPGV